MGRKFMILPTAVGTVRILGRPPLVIACRPEPSGLPVLGANTMPACAAMLPPSVVGTIRGLAQGVGEVVPLAQIKSPSSALRSPERSAAVGTVVTVEAVRRRRVP